MRFEQATAKCENVQNFEEKRRTEKITNLLSCGSEKSKFFLTKIINDLYHINCASTGRVLSIDGFSIIRRPLPRIMAFLGFTHLNK